MTLNDLKNNLYKFCIVVWIIVSVFFSRTELNSVIGDKAVAIYTLGRLIIYFLLLFIILWGGINKKYIPVFVIILVVLLINTILSGETVLMGVLLFILASKWTTSEEIIRIFLKTHLIILIITFFLAAVNIIEMNVVSRGLIQRNSFGFTHPNTFGGEVITVYLCYLTMKWKNISNIKIILITLFSLYFLYKADCRMAIVIIATYTAVLLLVKNIYKYKINVNFIKNIVSIILTLIIAITIFATLFYSYQNRFVRMIDEMFSYRFNAMYSIYKLQGISMFGQKILNDNVVGIDNSFARVLLIDGIFPFIILIIFSFMICNEFAKNGKVEYLLAFAAIILSGFIENSFFRIENNFCFLIGGIYLLSHYYVRKGFKYDKIIDRERI